MPVFQRSDLSDAGGQCTIIVQERLEGEGCACPLVPQLVSNNQHPPPTIGAIMNLARAGSPRGNERQKNALETCRSPNFTRRGPVHASYSAQRIAQPGDEVASRL